MKRLFVVGGFDLGLLMRTIIGVGTPRGLQGRLAPLITLVMTVRTAVVAFWPVSAAHAADFTRILVSNCFSSGASESAI